MLRRRMEEGHDFFRGDVRLDTVARGEEVSASPAQGLDHPPDFFLDLRRGSPGKKPLGVNGSVEG